MWIYQRKNTLHSYQLINLEDNKFLIGTSLIKKAVKRPRTYTSDCFIGYQLWKFETNTLSLIMSHGRSNYQFDIWYLKILSLYAQ